MEKFILVEDEWKTYKRKLLERRSYKFVAWVGTDVEREILLIIPILSDYGKHFFHKDAIKKARDAGVITESEVGKQNAFGAIREIDKEDDDKRISSWCSVKFGSTSKRFRECIRQSLDLKDVN